MDKYLKVLINILNYILGSVFNIALFVISLVLIVTISSRAYDYGKNILSLDGKSSGIDKVVTFTIPEDADTAEIASILKEAGFIDNELLFRLQAKLNGTDDLFRSGTYELNLSITQNDLMEQLQRVRPQVVSNEKITIPEGLTIRQIGEILEAKEYFSADDFVTACNDIDAFKNDFYFLDEIPQKRENPLSGYLFPDTYFIPEEPTPYQVIVRMLKRFEDIYSFEYAERAEDLGMTMDEVVTLASIIEKEVRIPSERALAASVMHNRLATDMRLQMCSTVLYALDKSRDRLTLADLEVKSPYNTYLNWGLPPGPIACPGQASIEAVLYPADTKYIYFVLKDLKTGEHFFTDDYNEFLRAKELYKDEF